MSEVDAEDRSGRWWLDRADLIGKTAIITGGAGGLGEAITLDLASNGVNIALIDRDEAATKRISKELISRGVEAIVHTGDVRKSDDLDALFEAVADKWKHLDVLVNVVGGTFKGAFTEQSDTALPMGRLGTPSDISNAVIFLASGLSSYMTGMTLHPDGGTFASAGWLNWPDEGFSNILPSSVLQHYTSPPPS